MCCHHEFMQYKSEVKQIDEEGSSELLYLLVIAA